MKKITTACAFMLLVGIVPAFAAFPEDFKNQNRVAAPTKVDIAPMELKQKFDYTAGPGTSPVYIGHAAAGTATSANKWIIWKYTYSGANPTDRDTAYGSWDDRATLSYS